MDTVRWYNVSQVALIVTIAHSQPIIIFINALVGDAISKWFNLSLSLSCSFNASIVVSSVGGGEVRVPVDVSLAWPNLVKEKLVTLEPTTVGNTSVSQGT